MYKLIIAFCGALICLLLSISFGSTPISLYTAFTIKNSAAHHILIDFRLPHTIHAFIIGGLLALSGLMMQLLTRNPMADPYLLGVSLGASFFLLLAMLCHLALIFLPLSALFGSLLSILLIFFLTQRQQFHAHSFILAGIALASLYSTGISLLLFYLPARELNGALFWLLGDLSETSFNIYNAAILLLALAVALIFAPGFNLLGRGEYAAKALGLASQRYRLLLFLLSALCTAAAVTSAGCIGFIGLITPHLTRFYAKENGRLFYLLSALLGGSLLSLADTLSRTFLAEQPLPVGMITALLGLPLFLWLLSKKTTSALSCKH